MKIALITDTHWGVRNDNNAFLDNNKIFLDTVFFPFLSKNGIDTLIHLGDVVDRRKYININTAKRLREDFLKPISEMQIDFHIIAGNHDTYFKNTNEVNSIRELIADKYDFKIYDKFPEEVIFDECPILFIPWICDQNRKGTMESINACKSTIAMGHLEIQGFEMYKGSIVSHGDDARVFDRFDMVMSGHYHHRSNNGHIFYLGSHAEFTWSDYNDPKGFHIFDTETRELNFIENPYKIFKKIWYDDSSSDLNNILESVNDELKNSIIKVIVKTKNNPYWFDLFIDKIEKHNPIDLQIVEDHLNLNLEEDSDIVNEAEDTITIFKNYIEQINSDSINKERLQNTMLDLYNEAMSLE